jgi:hypothetical protein
VVVVVVAVEGGGCGVGIGGSGSVGIDDCNLFLLSVMVGICEGFLRFLMLMDFDGGYFCFGAGGVCEGGQQW